MFRQAAKRLLGNKKGIELSMTVIVLLIISIIIFIGGISMLWKFFAGAEEIKAGIEQRTRDQIEALLREGTDLVAIPVNTKESGIGKETAFGLGIRNIARERPAEDFYLQINFDGVYDSRGKSLGEPDPGSVEQRWLGGFQAQGPITIARNDFEIVPLHVRTAAILDQSMQTPKGSLVVFNVCVYAEANKGPCALNTPAETLYGSKVRQIVVQVR